MAKSQDAKKTVKKEPLKTAKEKKEEKREKKNSPKRDQTINNPFGVETFERVTLFILFLKKIKKTLLYNRY